MYVQSLLTSNTGSNGVSRRENSETESGQLNTISPTHSLLSQQSVSLAENPFIKISTHFFSEENTQFLEGNFIGNHVMVGDSECVRDSMTALIKQAQVS